MSKEDVVEELVEMADETRKLVEAQDMSSASGLYVSKGYVLGFVVLGVGAVAAAGYFGYRYASRRLEAKYEEISRQEIAEAKAFYSKLYKKGPENDSPEKVVKSLERNAVKATQEYQGMEGETAAQEVGEEDEEAGEVYSADYQGPEEGSASNDVNVFADLAVKDEHMDEVDVENRDPDHPYIITEEEFLANETDFSQTSITYYAGDQTLADERDQEIPYLDPIVGASNVNEFGRGSSDPRIVHIRNERLSTDFEVVKHDGKFAYEVMGLEHADGGHRGQKIMNRPRKVRGEFG